MEELALLQAEEEELGELLEIATNEAAEVIQTMVRGRFGRAEGCRLRQARRVRCAVVVPSSIFTSTYCLLHTLA